MRLLTSHTLLPLDSPGRWGRGSAAAPAARSAAGQGMQHVAHTLQHQLEGSSPGLYPRSGFIAISTYF